MKILKWILGLLAGIGGIVAIFAGGKSNKKVKEIKNKIKDNEKKTKSIDKQIKNLEKENTTLNKSLKSKKQALKEIKKHKKNFKTKDVGSKDAANFLKGYAKKKKK
tara:strand:+ start:311 stop:628 length:318 start_codon:yes stop_codon:yes gene_type:complete